MITHLYSIGTLQIALAMVHGIFPRYFQWRTELAPLNLINRQMMQVHTFFIALTVGLLGLLCLSSAHDLVQTPLGRRVALGMAVFWGTRLVFQFAVYSSDLWRGKRFETAAHVAFSGLWAYFTGTLIWVAVGQ
jgi:hypothetical protein